MNIKWNWKNLVKDIVRFGIAWGIVAVGHPIIAIGFLAFFDVQMKP